MTTRWYENIDGLGWLDIGIISGSIPDNQLSGQVLWCYY